MLKRRLRARVTRRRKKGGTKVVQTQFGTFDSGEEAERFQQLMTWEDEGRISNLRRGERLELQPGFRDMSGYKWRAWTYTPDFVYTVPEYDIEVVEDFKGRRPPEWSIKERRIRYKYPEMHFYVNCAIDGWYVPPEPQP